MYVMHKKEGAAILRRLTPRQLFAARQSATQGETFERVSGRIARAWVRLDFPHATPLALDVDGGVYLTRGTR